MNSAVICPVRLSAREQVPVLLTTVETVRSQTDDSWHLVLVDDASPLDGAADVLAGVRADLGDHATVLRQPVNAGQGVCRNAGARWAWRNGIGICHYLDSDDLADPGRVAAVRSIMADAGSAFVYSGFHLVDEYGEPVAEEAVAPSIVEILEAHRSGPIEGAGVWRALGTTLGYTTLTSTVSVRTWLAVSQPFPDCFVSEDQHAWLRMTAATDGVRFDAASYTSYRITTDGSGSSVRRRIGDGYYAQKAWVDTMGFLAAVRIALRRSTVSPSEVPALVAACFARCAVTLDGAGEHDTAREYRELVDGVGALEGLAALRVVPSRPTLFRPAV